MSDMQAWALAVLAGVAGVAVASLARASAEVPDPRLRADLEALSSRTIFFGHQSVGGNVLEGVLRLSARAGVPLRLVEGTAASAPPGTVVHALLGRNGAPLEKIDDFARAVDAFPGDGPDVALMKLCYVDFDGGADPAALFARYRTVLAELRRRHPRTRFVHVTTPLTAPARGARALAKRLLGRERDEARNARREAYNALLRDAYAGREPVLDLARIEATRPDGSVEATVWSGRAVPALVPAYTDDGGHLNAAGQERVARRLVALLAGGP